MKLVSFTANDVHGYMNFEIKFNRDVNFIAGLNGSGKTTALNIIASLISPSIEDLSKIVFTYAKLELDDENGNTFSIIAKQNSETLEISTSATPDSPPLSSNLLELRHSIDRSASNRARASEVFKFIANLPSPMYLSLDRRFIKESTPFDSSPLSLTMLLDANKSTKENNLDSSIKEALELISKKSAEIKDKQTQEDRKLRDLIILDSFYVDQSPSSGMAMPGRNTHNELRKKQATIKDTLISLDFKADEFGNMYDGFFDNLIHLAKNVYEVFSFHSKQQNESSKTSATAKKKSLDSAPQQKPQKDKINPLSLENSKILGNWFANSHQMARIDRLIHLIGEYEKKKSQIYAPLVKFTELVNLFLNQTKKSIKITNQGEVRIFINQAEKSLTMLSSGERQILIMLAHLSLNSHLPKSGIFIVDEPELSLHIAWQDMFLEAVQAAGPDLQIVLATHSPAIIGGRNNYYIPLNGGI